MLPNISIRKAKREEAQIITPFLLLAMEDIVYEFIGEKSSEKAKHFLTSLIDEPKNQYSYENCWVAELAHKIVGVALVYDGGQLNELRAPVLQKIASSYHRKLKPEDETAEGEYYIDCVGVDTSLQGQGIGSRILRFLIDEYVTKAGRTLGLLVDKENPNAEKLYLKLGFEIVGEKTLVGKKLNHLQYKI
jgi:ribosomal protein S18 acetylase RimI-like enzyme